MRKEPLRLLFLLAVTSLLAAIPAVAQCPPLGPQSGNTVTQQFPPSGAAVTGWQVTYGHATSKGLYITGAYFRRAPNEPLIKVLHDARLSDIFVPYHAGSPRFYDLTQFSFNLVPVQAVDRGPCGQNADAFVVKELLDRGMLWKNDTAGRRGYELVLWATLDAANYNYVMRYGFRDDGTITFRLGATAVNLPSKPLEAHHHDGLWRLDIDLNGSNSDTVTLHSHNETTAAPAANDTVALFNGGVEGFADIEPLKYTMLNVRDELKKNAQGKKISYDLMAMREGQPRHQETFAHHDFWVTQYDFTQTLYKQIQTYVNPAQSIQNTDVVVWYISPMHHMPRSEDGKFVGNFWQGTALLMMGGFDLRPRDLFDTTPFYP